MQTWRIAYLTYVLVLAVAHAWVTLSPWTSPLGGTTLTATWWVLLFGGWLLAGVVDLALSLCRVMPLSFAVEAAVALLSVAILATMPATLWLVALCALVAPVWVVVKAVTELCGRTPALLLP
jgi:hypothetical protein